MRGLAIIPRTLGLSALAVIASLATAAGARSEERIIVKRDPGLSAAERAEVRTGAGAQLVDVLRLPQTEVVTVPAADSDDALAELNADPRVVYAEPDRARTAFAAPDDPYWPSQWALSNTGQFGGTPGADIHVLEAWPYTQGAGQTVAVVDSGIDAGHTDLAGQIAAGGRNFVLGMAAGDVSDPLRHGTHVAGTIAARANNTVGVAGVAPAAKVLPLRVFDNQGFAYDSSIAQAFDYAGDLGVRVVNASLGGEDAGPNLTLSGAIADHPNTLYVAAAGNGGLDQVGDNNDVRGVPPCTVPQPNVLCVGATDYNDLRARFSNYGSRTVDLFAPGVDIASTVPGNAYASMNGTSMAAPHVSGEAALLLAAAPALGAQALKGLIMGTVDQRASLSGLAVTGGRANAGAAFRQLLAGDADGDGVADFFDACPTVAGSGADGCPIAAPPPGGEPPPPPPPPAAPGRPAAAAPPTVRSLTVKVSPRRCRRSRACRRSLSVAVGGDAGATAKVTIERRRCSHRRCRWAPVATRSTTISSGAASVTVRGRSLVRGSYRATAVLSSSVGAGTPSRHSFRIR